MSTLPPYSAAYFLTSNRNVATPGQIPPISAARRSYRRNLAGRDRKSTRLNSSHGYISYAVFCLKKKKTRSASRPRMNKHRRAAELGSGTRHPGFQLVIVLLEAAHSGSHLSSQPACGGVRVTST